MQLRARSPSTCDGRRSLSLRAPRRPQREMRPAAPALERQRRACGTATSPEAEPRGSGTPIACTGPGDPERRPPLRRQQKLLVDPHARALTGPVAPGDEALHPVAATDGTALPSCTPLRGGRSERFDWGGRRDLREREWSRDPALRVPREGHDPTRHPAVPEALRGTLLRRSALPPVIEHLQSTRRDRAVA